ncbi:MAG TPA: 16S rRNA (guanine(966)-N(2))-methyltransferase RsmD [Thermoanaerobaculia bacterium]
MSSLRITAGTLRGRRVTVPPAAVRPTSERARQAYFNIVGGRIEGARFLDLFAGSGIFSFEALSRGAASATAVERDTRNVALIAKEAAAFGVQVKTVTADTLQFVRRAAEPFDLVYADPPYAYEDYGELVEVIGKLPLPPRALVAVEHRRGMRPFQQETGRLRLIRTAEYGEVWISFFGIAEAATGIAIGE